MRARESDWVQELAEIVGLTDAAWNWTRGPLPTPPDVLVDLLRWQHLCQSGAGRRSQLVTYFEGPARFEDVALTHLPPANKREVSIMAARFSIRTNMNNKNTQDSTSIKKVL